jgi:uncharacterized membrane protein YqjE
MIAETSRAGFPAGRGGVFAHMLAVANALARFVETRLELFTKESKAALAQLLALAGAIIAALLMFALGYMFLLAAAIALIASATNISWVWITLIVAGVHFMLALVCLLVARAMATKAPFRETAAELKKDREWLKNLDGTTRPTN